MAEHRAEDKSRQAGKRKIKELKEAEEKERLLKEAKCAKNK